MFYSSPPPATNAGVIFSMDINTVSIIIFICFIMLYIIYIYTYYTLLLLLWVPLNEVASIKVIRRTQFVLTMFTSFL